TRAVSPPSTTGGAPATSPPPRTPAPQTVELPYVAPGAASAPPGAGAGFRLSAGEVPTAPKAAPAPPRPEAARPAKGRLVPPGAAAPEPSPLPEPAVAEAALSPTRPDAPPAPRRPVTAPPLDDDFWSASPPPLADAEGEPTPDAAQAPRRETAVLADQDAESHGWSDIAVLDERTALAEDTRYSARAHPLGAWLNTVDDDIRHRWIYPPALRAFGTQGICVVRFRVARSGAVSNVYVQSSAGNAELDLAALAAIPARVPPMPAGSGSGVWLQWTFRYRASSP
ncbi:MAG: TonB family protein, partial [Pseudomonadota bacterium]|nr:TonB family protein [Pseudomonadota bacterium]